MRTGKPISWGRIVFYGLLALAGVWLLWAGRSLWFPLAIALMIAMVLDPTVDRLENRGCPRGVATLLVFLAFISGSILAIVLLSPGVSAQASAIARDLGRLFPNPDRPDLVPVTQKVLEKLEANPALRDALLNAARAGTDRLVSTLESASGWALAWAPNLIWLVLVPVMAFYLLNDFHRIYAKGILLVPPIHRPFAQSLVAEISALFGKYLRGLILLCSMLGVAICGVLYAFGNPYWLFLGLLGGLLYAVPAVGSMFTVCLVVLVTLVTATPAKALLAGGSLLLLTFGLFDQAITPRVLGRQVGLHPILTILSLMLGYQIMGIPGMLVAVPVAASIQTVVLHLIPKLGIDLELRPLEELKKTEADTRHEHLEAEETPLDEHFRLQAVVENVEGEAVRG